MKLFKEIEIIEENDEKWQSWKKVLQIEVSKSMKQNIEGNSNIEENEFWNQIIEENLEENEI